LANLYGRRVISCRPSILRKYILENSIIGCLDIFCQLMPEGYFPSPSSPPVYTYLLFYLTYRM
jgi:hypothetical protein